MVKSKLPPQSGSSLEAVEPHPKGGHILFKTIAIIIIIVIVVIIIIIIFKQIVMTPHAYPTTFLPHYSVLDPPE